MTWDHAYPEMPITNPPRRETWISRLASSVQGQLPIPDGQPGRPSRRDPRTHERHPGG
jgi:hypothetical protein